MHASYVKAVSKTKQALEQTRAEEASVAELRSKAVEYSRYEGTCWEQALTALRHTCMPRLTCALCICMLVMVHADQRWGSLTY